MYLGLVVRMSRRYRNVRRILLHGKREEVGLRARHRQNCRSKQSSTYTSSNAATASSRSVPVRAASTMASAKSVGSRSARSAPSPENGDIRCAASSLAIHSQGFRKFAVESGFRKGFQSFRIARDRKPSGSLAGSARFPTAITASTLYSLKILRSTSMQGWRRKRCGSCSPRATAKSL